MKFHGSKEKLFGSNELGKIIPVFNTSETPRLNRFHNYNIGKMPIIYKEYQDKDKKILPVVVNFCHELVMQMSGYLGPVQYNNDDKAFDVIRDILNWNDVSTADKELLENALEYGRAVELYGIDTDGKQRFKVIDPREAVPVYDDTMNEELLYLVRFWHETGIDMLPTNDNYWVEVYGPDDVKTYKSNMGGSSFELIAQRPHYYGMCPATVFELNKEAEPIFGQVMTLNDAYNDCITTQLSEWDNFADCMLKITGMQVDEEDAANIKQGRVLVLDEGADAQYLTKNINDATIQDMLKNYSDQIYNKAGVVSFMDEKFMSQSGIALRYKLQGMENTAACIASNYKKALQRRIELLSKIVSLTDTEKTWRDCQIIINRNLPDLLMPQSVTELMQYKGLVSTETLLGLVPFVNNVEEELKKVQAENELNMELYSFGATDEQVLEE